MGDDIIIIPHKFFKEITQAKTGTEYPGWRQLLSIGVETKPPKKNGRNDPHPLYLYDDGDDDGGGDC